MVAHGRAGNRTRGAFCLAMGLLAIFLNPAAAQPPAAGPNPTAAYVSDPMCSEAMRSDARLADVAFVDPQCGWAVGDRGAIWHTEDGGRHWHLQPSGVSCPLESIQFLDRQTGWAGGGFSRPYTHSGKGVLLTTTDGGRHWSQARGSILPALKRVRFFDARHGWAIGTPSAMFPAGVFVTDDGGRSWNPLAGPAIAAWQGGDFLDRTTAALAGSDGTAAVVRRGSVEPAKTPRFGLRRLADVELVSEIEPRIYGWLVGQGGLVMMTSDMGGTWHTPPGELPRGMISEFDFAAIEVRGPNAWIAGSPGSRILCTRDAGRSWTAAATGQNLPIEALTFVDDQHGWAVGALGIILATDDGGANWTRQRSGGKRAAMLGLFREANDVPLELVAQLSGDEGYLSAFALVGRRDVETPKSAGVPLEDRIHEAVVGAGGSDVRSAWQFPLAQAGLAPEAQQIVDQWNRANDGRATEALDAYLVRQIRLWRPEVVITHAAALADGDSAAARLIQEAVLRAVQQAEDPTAHSDQITVAGLGPWRAKRVIGCLGPEVHGTCKLLTTQLSMRLGGTLADVATKPRALVDDAWQPSPAALGFQILADNVEKSPERADFFTGISVPPGGDARRTLTLPTVDATDMIRRMAERRRNSEAILRSTDGDPRRAQSLLANVGELTRGLDPGGTGDVLHRLGQHYVRSGDWTLAADVFWRLADQYPDHPLTDAALVWLVEYYVSDEAAWRVRGSDRVRQASGTVVGAQHIPETSRPAIDANQDEDRLARAAAIGKRIEATRPELFVEPAVRFPLAKASRQRGFPADAQRYYLTKKMGSTHDAWSACAQGEQWLASDKAEAVAPKPLLRCVRSQAKPHLDGRLDEPCWQRAKPAVLASHSQDERNRPASVMLAYDEEFLYVGIRCGARVQGSGFRVQEEEKKETAGDHSQARRLQPAGQNQHAAATTEHSPASPIPPAATGGLEPAIPSPFDSQPATPRPRPRDGDLSGRDRVDVFLDIDRDYATYYRLTIDNRGWPNDACWGDAGWDPTWFVAAESDDEGWTAEAAIPLDQLTGTYPAAGTIWAIGIQRVTPGVGFQSWNTPASTEVMPEGFGYLVFE